MTPQGFQLSNARRRTFSSRRSPRSRGPHLTAQSWPLSRLSTVTGLYPARANALHAWLPTKPGPPVTRMVRIVALTFNIQHVIYCDRGSANGLTPVRTTRNDIPCQRTAWGSAPPTGASLPKTNCTEWRSDWTSGLDSLRSAGRLELEISPATSFHRVQL